MIQIMLLSALASAAEPALLVGFARESSIGLRTGLSGPGGHLGLAFELGGERNALHVEPRGYAAWVEGRRGVLPGVYLGWTHFYGDQPLHGYSLIGAGGYHSEVLPVMPVLGLSGGVEYERERLLLRVGPHLFTLPPFFIGGGVEANVGIRF